MSNFGNSRHVSSELIHSLEIESLYVNRIKKDIEKGEVFPAFRKDRVDFYYKGGKLFKYDGKFSTHIKFASVAVSEKTNPYITESELNSKIILITDFSRGYDRIKENCSRYSGDEDIGISSIYRRFPATAKGKGIVVLDIEIAFNTADEMQKDNQIDTADEIKRNNRIDILLFNTKTKTLRFYEAKHYSNKEIWSTANTKPRVVAQIKRYEEQIKDENAIILNEYCNYISRINEVWDCDLPMPLNIDPKACLLIFGFDANQRDGRLNKLLLSDNSLENIMHYEVGEPKTASIESIWNEARCN
jgi:hypothetical protein